MSFDIHGNLESPHQKLFSISFKKLGINLPMKLMARDFPPGYLNGLLIIYQTNPANNHL